MGHTQHKLPDARLSAAAAYVREGAVLADIGTDHGYLPIALCREGRIASAIAADVAREPLARAQANVAESGYGDKITCILTDGLSGLEGYGVTDITICGMGGELIARILSDAPFVRDSRIRLILQPMTMQAYLRRFLCREGFSIQSETIALAGGKLYPVLMCVYTGILSSLTDAEALLGAYNIEHRTQQPHFAAYLEKQTERHRTAMAGRLAGGSYSAEAAAADRVLLASLEKLCND